MDADALQGQAQADAATATEAAIVDLKAILKKHADECALDPAEKADPSQLVIRRILVNKDPDISLIPDFVTDAEIEHLL